VAFHEAEHFGVERQRCSLIVDEEGGQFDSHGVPFPATGHRRVIEASGSPLK
jgi:hypothetical protein